MKLSKDESRAIVFVLGLVALAAVARVIGRPHGTDLPAGSDIDAATLERKSQVALEREKASARPLRNDERIDVNSAGVEELDRLPGVGPGLAAKIVAERTSGGAFDSATDLRSVPGLGPALLRRLQAHLAFGPGDGLSRRESAVAGMTSKAGEHAAHVNGVKQPEGALGLRGARKTRAAEVPQSRNPATPQSPLDLNRATAAELEALPGIGPALAARIVARRDSAPFRNVEELVKVRGIGPATVARLRAYLRS